MNLRDKISNHNKKLHEIRLHVSKAYKHKNLLRQLLDIIFHKIVINSSPIDYYRYEIYKRKQTWTEKSYYLGKRGSKYYPWEKNYIKFVPLFDNKFIFKTLLEGMGLITSAETYFDHRRGIRNPYPATILFAHGFY